MSTPSAEANGESIYPLIVRFDELLEHLMRPRASTFQCQVDGVIYDVAVRPEGTDAHLYFKAMLGYLPFTAESAPKRKCLKAIVETLGNIPHLDFSCDDQGLIALKGEAALSSNEAQEVNFARLVQLIYQARPFVHLLGTYL